MNIIFFQKSNIVSEPFGIFNHWETIPSVARHLCSYTPIKQICRGILNAIGGFNSDQTNTVNNFLFKSCILDNNFHFHILDKATHYS